jgi:hypothetical protein
VSNYFAIATVTAALQQLLQPAVKRAVLGANVGFSRPDVNDDQKTPLVNVFLYQITPNAALRNRSLPSRSSDGSPARRPAAALDLHYLFTFHGNHDQFEPQLLMGAVIAQLEAQPVLTSDIITAAIKGNSWLKDSTLDTQAESIQFTPTALTLDEFSKLWSAFFQVEYNLSMVYQASVVLMEPQLAARQAPPVQVPKVYVQTLHMPRIQRIVAASGDDDPILSSSTLRIIGEQLRGADTVVLLEDQERTPATVTDSEIQLPYPSDAHAGLQSLQVVHRMLMGAPALVHRSVESALAAFVVRPWIVNAVAALNPKSSPAVKITDVTLTLTPNVGVGQRMVLALIAQAGSPPGGFVSTAVGSDADTSIVTISIDNVPAGTYLVRVQIDGAESPLAMSGGVFSDPTVTMP